MTIDTTLYLHEEIMLLALRDEEGTLATSAMMDYTLAGAIMSDLLLQRRIRIDSSTRRKLVEVVKPTPLGHILLDESLDRIVIAKRRASIQTWVSRLARIKKLRHRAVQRLCELSILRQAEDKMLWVFPRTIYPEVNHTPEARLVERLRQAIFSEAQDPDSATVVLIALAQGANLLSNVFDKRQLKSCKKRIQMIAKGDVIGQATKEVMDAVQAAIMAACVVTTVMS